MGNLNSPGSKFEKRQELMRQYDEKIEKINDKYLERYRLVNEYEASGYRREMRLTKISKEHDRELEKVRQWYAIR